MNTRLGQFFLASASLLGAAVLHAQTTTAPAAPTTALLGDTPPLFDPAQLPAFEGKVQQFILAPRGEIDGLILTDGTEVKTPPHLSTAVAYAIRPGDSVTIHGLHAANIPLLQASSIIDHTSGRTVVDQGPAGGPPGPGRGRVSEASVSEVTGAIRMNLHGPRGEINGVLLNDGTVLRLPPESADSMKALLQSGRTIVARGESLSSPVGKVMEVRELGASRNALTPIAPPPGPGLLGVRPPPRGAAAPPPPPPQAG